MKEYPKLNDAKSPDELEEIISEENKDELIEKIVDFLKKPFEIL